MPERITFSPLPADTSPGPLELIPEPEGSLYQESGFVPPPPNSGEPAPEMAGAASFVPPPPGSGDPAPEMRGAWQQRVDELAIGIARADQMMNVFGAAVASSAKDRYTDQEAELLREDERQKLRDDAEIQRGIEAIRQRPGPPATEDEIDVWVQKQVDRHRARDERASERRAEIEQRLRDLKAGKDEEITEAAKNLALMQQVIEEIPQSESMKKFMEAEGGAEAVKVLLTNPTGFVDLALESLPASMGGMAIGAVGGAMTGNPLLTAFGAGLGAGLPEMAGMMMQVMSEMKVDLTDPAQIEAFLADPVKRAEAYNKGLLKGGTIGGINAFFGGIAGKFLGKAIDAGAGFATKAGAAMLDTAINLGGEGVAEGASQIVTEGKLDWKDMVAEVGGAGPMAFQEITTNVIGQTRLARDEIVDPTMEILRESTQKLADAARMLEAAQAAEQENASNAVHAPDAAVAAVTEDTGNLDELDLVADAQRGIEEDTQEAIDNQAEIKAAAEAAAAEAQQAAEELTAAQELLQSDEVRALEDDVRSAEQLQLYFQTAEALDTINPEAAAMMRHPKAAELFEAQRSTLPGNIFVEVQNADGSVEPGLFSGYFTPDIVSFGRYAPNENGFSHGAINPKKEGRTILTPIPSFEEWNAAQEAEAEAAQAAKAALPVVEVTPEEAAGSTATPITPTEDAVQISQATPVPRQPEAGGIQEVPETLGQTPAEAETLTLQGEQVVEQQTPDLQAAEERRVAIEDGMLDQAAEAEALAEAEAVAAYESADEAEIQAQDLARQAELEDEAEVEATIREAAEVAADEAAAAGFVPPPPNTGETAPETTQERPPIMGPETQARLDAGPESVTTTETAEDTRGNIGPEGLSVPISAPETIEERTGPFEVDEVLNIADPDGTPSGTATYRGPDLNNPNKSVVWTGRSQISVNNWQLSRPTTETVTTEPEVIPEVAASREQLLELAGISEQDFADLEAVEALDARVGRDTIEDAGIPKRRLTSLRKRGLISSTQPILEMGGRIALGTARGRDMMTGETITVPAPAQAPTETLATPAEGFGAPPIVTEMVETVREAGRAISNRVSNVQLAPMQEGQTNERITFEFDGQTYESDLLGRNADLVVGMGEAEDKAIAARTLIDGDATPVTAPTETLPDATPAELTAEQEANLIDLNLLDRFIETVDGDVTNLSSPGTLTRRIKRALDKNWITPEEAAEIRRIQKDMGSRDDTQDAFDELRTTLEFKREDVQGQTGIEPGQMEEGQETFGTQFPEDTMTVAAKRKLLRPAISRILPNGVVANLPIDELLSIRTVTGAARVRRLYTTAVTSQEIAAVAQMGEAGRFWYNDFRSMLEAMNVPPEQEYILAGVLATTSPNKSVRENVNWTVRVLKAWDEAGRPTENDAVIDALTPLKMWDSDFANTVAILSNPDFESAFAGLSDQSPKVKPFYEALMGNENAVVLDTHMARFFGLRQSKVAKTNANRALTSRVRNIAGRLGWTPAQTQAAIWAVARYYGNAIGPNVGPNIAGRSRVPGIMAQPVTNDVLLKEDDIATLLTEDFADDFNELGFDTAAGARSLARTRTGRPTVAGGRGQTLGVSYQRSLGRRFEARFIDDRARKNGEPVASDSLFESTEQYGNEYADSLEITDPVRREESMGYVEAAIEGETETGPEYTETDESAPPSDLDAEFLLGPVGIVTDTARQRLESGERISVILAEHVKGERPVFEIIGTFLKDTVDFVQTMMSIRSPYQESVKIAFVDRNDRVVHSEILSMGTLKTVKINEQLVTDAYFRAREKGATERRFYIAHNHPSGQTNPSGADLAQEAILEEYVQEFGGEMVDFVVTNGNSFYSMKAGKQVPLAEPNRAAWEGVPDSDRRTLATVRQMQAMVAILRQGNPEAEFIVYTNHRLKVMGVEQVPPGLTAAEWAARAQEGVRLTASTGVNLVTSQGETETLAIVDAISPSGILIQDVSSNDRPSWYAAGVLAEGALVEGAEARVQGGLAEDQLEFGLDPEEVRKAAAPHEVVPPPPPPPPAVSSQGSVEQAIAATGNAPDAAVSLNQKFPATEIAQYNVADLDEASTEAVDAEGLELIQNATADDLQELGVTKTQVFGKMMTILGRRGDTAAERTRAIQRAGRAFSEAGLSVEFDPANEVYRLTDPANPDELGGRALVDILKRELELGADGGRPFLSVLINSVRNKDGGMWVSPAFSQSIRNELFSLAQGEASFYGLMLGALHKHKRSLNFVASHVDVYLNRAYSKAFGGEAIGNMMDGVRREATQTATEELDKSVTPKMAGVLNRLDSMNQQGVDLDYFMGQVLDQIGKGERTAADQTEIDQLPDLFDLPNWRNMITQRGGNQIADNILRMINPQETQDDDGFIEGNVKRMDRLLQADLNKIVKEVIPQIAKERQQPNFLQDLMTATGDIQTRQERLDLVDQRVNEELDAAEARDLEDENLDPDEVEQKYAMIREKWDEQFTQISSTLTSDAMVRRIVNQHLREVFAERNIKWGDVAKGQASVQEINEALMRRIRESFNEFNQRAPESALTENQTEQILTVLSNGFEQMARTKLENFRANQAAAAARRAEELPQRTAEGELNRLAVLHSDVQEWSVAEENAVKEAIKAQRETPASPEVFEETLIGLGVSQPTARSLSGIINRDIDARRRHEQLRREQRVASPRPERGTQEEQERKTGIKGLVDRIFAAPPRQQRDPRWQRRTALAYFQENGLNQAEAEDAWNLFKTDFVGLLKQAAKRGLETMRANLSSREKKVMNAKTGRLQLWERLERAINAGVFDQSEILKQFAAEFGWTVPTDAQVSNLKALSAREQELSGLTEDERQQIGDDPDALEAARINKAAATMNERLRLQNRMHTLYAQFSRPITWRTAEGRKNFGEAAREFISANMLFKLGFGIKQVIDVGTQWAFHMPARAIASSITRYQEAELAGDPTDFWGDVSGAIGDSVTNISTFASQAVVQWRQAMQGEGVRRNIEGMRSTISGFDRMKAEIRKNQQEVQELRNDPDYENDIEAQAVAAALSTKNAILHLMGLAEIALRFTRAMDNIQGVFVEQQEVRERLVSEILRYGEIKSPTDARRIANQILLDWRREQDLALARAKGVADENNIESSPNELRATGYEIFKSDQYSRIKAVGLDANQIQEYTETQRQTVGWNMPEETGIGGAVGVSVRALSRQIERLGIPLPLGQFSNAIAIGINRGLTWTPLGFFPSAFGGIEGATGEGANAWFKTPEDRMHRKFEAALGTSMGLAFTAMAVQGMMRVWIKPPDDPEERRIWQKEGHRAGTVEFAVGNGKFIPISLTSGPISFFRVPLTAIAAVQDAADASARRRERLEADAAAKGVPAGDIPALTMDDVAAAASLGAFSAIMGGRTAGGALRSFRAGTERDAMTVKTAITAQLSPFVVGLPGLQELQRAQEIRLDPRRASIIDLMYPTQGSDKRQYNFLSDELGPGLFQQSVQTFTGGTFGIVDPARLDADPAYKIFRAIKYRPSPIERQKGVFINGQIRVLTDEEYGKAQFERGKILKEMISTVDPDQDPAVLTAYALKYSAVSKWKALESIRAQDPELNMTNFRFGTAKTMPQQAQELFGELQALPGDQRILAYQEALAEGRIPLLNGDAHPDFLKEWRRLSQTNARARP